MPQLHAVLTGDLIASTEAPPEAVEAAMARIRGTIVWITPAPRFTRFRGDGWQIHLAKPDLGLRVMLQIAATLRAAAGLETRQSLGLGSAHGLEGPTLGAAGGTAFTASGRALDSMAEGRRLVLSGAPTDPLHRRLITMIDEQIAGWSTEQAEAVAHLLDPDAPKTRTAIAAQLGISRQALAARLEAAGFRQLSGACADFGNTFTREPPHA